MRQKIAERKRVLAAKRQAAEQRKAAVLTTPLKKRKTQEQKRKHTRYVLGFEEKESWSSWSSWTPPSIESSSDSESDAVDTGGSHAAAPAVGVPGSLTLRPALSTGAGQRRGSSASHQSRSVNT